LLLPCGWVLSAEGRRELDRVVRAAVAPEAGLRSMSRRGDNVWFLTLTSDAELVVAAIKDIAKEHMQRLTPPGEREDLSP
jgi:hypothetical protein